MAIFVVHMNVIIEGQKDHVWCNHDVRDGQS